MKTTTNTILEADLENKAVTAEKSLGFFEWQDYFSEVTRLIVRDGGEVTTPHPTKSATVHQRLEALRNLDLLPTQEKGGAE